MLVAWGTPGGAATARRLRAGGQVRATWVHPREGTALLPLGCGGPSSFWGGDKVGTKGSLSPGGGTGVLWGAGLLGAQGLCWPRGRGPDRDLSVERSPVNGQRVWLRLLIRSSSQGWGRFPVSCSPRSLFEDRSGTLLRMLSGGRCLWPTQQVVRQNQEWQRGWGVGRPAGTVSWG